MNNDQPGLGETNTIKRLKKGDLNRSEILVKTYQDAGGNLAGTGILLNTLLPG